MVHLIHLPEAIFELLLPPFLKQDDLRQLMNCSKAHFNVVKRKTMIYNLTREYCIRYCEDESFRAILIGKVVNPMSQIKVELLDSEEVIRYQHIFDDYPVYLSFSCINVFDYQFIRGLRSIYLDLDEIEDDHIIDLSPFRNCEKVYISDYLGDLDLSPLIDCQEITLDNCNKIKNFSCLTRQISLTLVNNSNLTNISNFHNLQEIVLSRCHSFIDITPFKGIPKLSLSYCPQIYDISVLGNHKELKINACSDILKGYPILYGIPVVELCACDISDLTILNASKIVKLERCDEIIDVSPLRTVNEVSLIDCAKIKDISMLDNLRRLTLGSRMKIKSYENLHKIRNLSITCFNEANSMLNLVPFAHHLEINYDDAMEQIAKSYHSFTRSFQNLRILYLNSISRLQDLEISGCEDIHTVYIYHCYLKSIEGLGRNREVHLYRCEGDINVSSLVNVPIVTIKSCKIVRNIEQLKDVPCLKISENNLFSTT